ncbi:MAG TPA: hypothetical protein VFT51_12965 [Bacillales bacterium]|nr:hypothetical protein [Bacillales bacterium]
MKIIFSFLMLGSLITLNSCSDEKFYYPDLLSSEEGKTSIVVIQDLSTKKDDVFWNKVMTDLNALYMEGDFLTKQYVKSEYPKLDFKKTPVVLIYNHEKMVYKTYDMDEAFQYLNKITDK